MVEFPPGRFGEPVAGIVAHNCGRTIPLIQTSNCESAQWKLLSGRSTRELFPNARDADSALSGLALYLGCWNEAHEVAQDVTSREGSYWHAIAHRIEPDSYNSGYWFRRVGEHPIFPSLYSESAAILEQHRGAGWNLKNAWDPFLFIEWCEQARREPGGVQEQAALAIQMAEWRLCSIGAAKHLSDNDLHLQPLTRSANSPNDQSAGTPSATLRSLSFKLRRRYLGLPLRLC